MPLKAESKMTSDAVIIAMPITEIRVIRFITFFLRLDERYLRAM